MNIDERDAIRAPQQKLPPGTTGARRGDLWDLWALAGRGAINHDAAELYRALGPTNRLPASTGPDSRWHGDGSLQSARAPRADPVVVAQGTDPVDDIPSQLV